MKNLGNYWRKELGTEFRNKALEHIGYYVEHIGDFYMCDDNKHYVATFNISEETDTIFPLGISRRITYMENRLISKIEVKGRIGKGKFAMDRHIIEQVSLYDIQNNKIDNSNICIDSLLYLLDFLESKKNNK